VAAALVAPAGGTEHPLGLIEPDDFAPRPLDQREGDHPGPRGDIEDPLAGTGIDGFDERAPPAGVLPEAEDRPHPVIPAGEALEELERVTLARGLDHRA
jgi:hypothetical protein